MTEIILILAILILDFISLYIVTRTQNRLKDLEKRVKDMERDVAKFHETPEVSVR